MNQMKANLDLVKEQRDSETVRGNNLEKELHEARASLHETQSKNYDLEIKLNNLEKQNKILSNELRKTQTSLSEVKCYNAMLESKADHLEKEKVELVLEQISHVKEIDSLQQQKRLLEENMENIKGTLSNEIATKELEIHRRESSEDQVVALSADITNLQRDLDEAREQINRMIEEKLKSDEQYQDEITERDKKITELSSKKSEVVADLCSLKDEIVSLRDASSTDSNQWKKEKTDLMYQVINIVIAACIVRVITCNVCKY